MESVGTVVKQGLLSSPRSLPGWYMYDREGSVRWEALKVREHYYMHRAEMEILEKHAKAIVEELPCPIALADFGCGDAVKTRLLLNEMLKRQPCLTYYAVDISADYLQKTCAVLSEEYGKERLQVVPIPGDYTDAISKISTTDEDKVITFFEGLQNLLHADQIELLRRLSVAMSAKDRLIVSLDITQDRTDIELAYKPIGNPLNYLPYNSILRLNKEFGNGEIDTAKFSLELDVVMDTDLHHASVARRMAVSACQQTYQLRPLGLTVEFQAGERMCVGESYKYSQESYKYSQEQVEYLLTKGNQEIIKMLQDKKGHVGIFFLKALRGD